MSPDAPRPSVRAEHAQRTRDRILDAVVDLVSERRDCDFTMPDVARASGVSLRTLYRYFPNRQQLVDSVATVVDQAAESNLPAAEFDLADLGPWLEQAWRNLLTHEAFIRAQHTSPNGAAIRRARIPFFREVTRTLLLREVPAIADDRVDDVVDTALLLVSSSALFEFIDVLEIPLERAARLASEAIMRVIDEAGRSGSAPK
jgi:AcrR family transcriptional regulator